MYKGKKTTALLLALVMVFSLLLNPFSAAYANAPPKPVLKPPTLNSPAVNTPKITPSSAAPIKLEAPARAQGVKYEFKDGIKRLPTTFDYDFKSLTLEQFASMAPDAGGSLPNTPPSTGIGVNLPNISMPGGAAQSPAGQSSNASGNQSTLDRIDGIKYPPGSKILCVPKTLAASFSPKINEIYVDEEMGTAFRILDIMDADAEGNPQYVVETPQLTDIFKSYSIPEQTINLTTGNIAYIAPEFELSPESGMPKNYVAKADGVTVYENEYITCQLDGNKHILNFKKGITLFEYPSKEDKKEDAEAKKKALKEKFEGDWWEADQSGDLRGVENESSFSVRVGVKEGHVTIINPQMQTAFELNEFSLIDAQFSFVAQAEVDVTLDGDLTFNKTIEKCVYGYEVDLGQIMGAEKGNKAFIGIFIVLGINGKIHVEVRTVTTGKAKAGFAYKAFGFGLAPYYVGPISSFDPATFDMSFTVDGEINTTLACVPQVGVIIWGFELGVLQVWLGFKSTARFHIDGGVGNTTDESLSGDGTIDLRGFGELVGYLFGSRYSIFYIELPIFYGEWKIGEEASGSAGDATREVPPYTMVTADASTNVVEGKVAFSVAGKVEAGYIDDGAALDSKLKPYDNQAVDIEVYDQNAGFKFKRTVTTDAEGKFTAKFDGSENIFPKDKVYINVPRKMEKVEVQVPNPVPGWPPVIVEVEKDNTPVYEVNSNKYRVVGKSPEIKPTVPFSKLDFNVDTFNDVITGWVSGNYTGPVEINMIGVGTVNAQAVNGVFMMPYPIDERVHLVTASINFEDCRFPYPFGQTRTRNLNALTLHVFNDFKPAEASNSESSTGVMTPVAIKDRLPSFNVPGLPDDLTGQDTAGRKIVKPTRVIGTITNKGDMGWVERQGDSYIRTGPSTALKHFDGNVTITALDVQTALEALMKKFEGRHANWIPRPKSGPSWTATSRAQQVMHLKPIPDSSAPMGVRIEQVPTSTGKFEFNQPDVVAYKIDIEYEGLDLNYIYNPYVYQYSKNQESIEDFIGPLIKDVTFVTEDKVDSIINPADVMNQWQGSWVTNVGVMQLTQKGTSVSGNIMQGTTSVPIQGTVTNGVFNGTYGNNMSFQMNISADGKTINFKNFGATGSLGGLNGTKATRQ